MRLYFSIYVKDLFDLISFARPKLLSPICCPTLFCDCLSTIFDGLVDNTTRINFGTAFSTSGSVGQCPLIYSDSANSKLLAPIRGN